MKNQRLFAQSVKAYVFVGIGSASAKWKLTKSDGGLLVVSDTLVWLQCYCLYAGLSLSFEIEAGSTTFCII